MAYAHLREALTKGNLWIYILSVLDEGPRAPREVKAEVQRRYGFSPATITFYAVLYRLDNERLVRKTTEKFRSDYEITPAGKAQLAKAKELLAEVGRRLSG